MGAITNLYRQAEHEKPEEVGHGFKVYDVSSHGAHEDLILYNHSILSNQVMAAEKYEARHDGMLPHTTFWAASDRIYDQDKSLFRITHECPQLIHVLRVGDFYNLTHQLSAGSPGGGTVAPPGSGPGGSVAPPGGGGNSPTPASVPEPSSLLLLSMGIAVLARWRMRRSATEATKSR